MENKKIKATDVLFIGLAFFATYFGAGNLIFPPMLGLQSGTEWAGGMIGMLLSGVGLPILTLLVLGKCGSVKEITQYVHPKFYTIFIGMIMVLCCCVSIPRTAAVGIEMGLQGVWGGAPYIPAVLIYFVIVFMFAKDRGSALDKIGKLLTPAMTVILVILVIKGALMPIGEPSEAEFVNPALESFLGGYSTGDVLVSFLMASVFFSTITSKGYTEKQFKQVNFMSAVIAAICLAVIYGGLLFMGACVSGEYNAADISNAELLLTIIRRSGGQIAIYGLCISVVLACLTTAIGQVTAVSDFFEETTNKKLPYSKLVIAVPVITTLVASLGLDTIVSLTSPWFNFTYPIALVCMLLGMFKNFIPNAGCYKGAVYLTIVYAFMDIPSQYSIRVGFLDAILGRIPLYSLGFGWVVPALIGFVIGFIVYSTKKENA